MNMFVKQNDGEGGKWSRSLFPFSQEMLMAIPGGGQRSYKIQIPISRANFGAKTGEADCKCLECGQRLPIVHRENIILDLSTLKYHSFIILNAPWLPGARWSNKLEVLHRGNHNPTMKIQTPALQILMPTWCFIVQNQGTRGAELLCLVLIYCSVLIYWALDTAVYSSGSSWFEKIVFIGHFSGFNIASGNERVYLLPCKPGSVSADWHVSTFIL